MRERFVIVPKEEICLFIAFYQRTSKSEHPTYDFFKGVAKTFEG